jgi:hypothetical protein
MNEMFTSVGNPVENQSALEELTDEQSDSVIGGGLLLPAIQKTRDASQPMETLSLNF